MTPHRCRAAALAVAFGLAAVSPADAAPQTFNTALPVARGEFVFRQQFLIRQADGDAPDRELRVRGSVSVLGFGVTPDLAVFGAVPVFDKALEVAAPGGQVTRRASGIGDARLFARYTLFRDDAPGRTFRVAPFAGVEFPTGEDNERDGLGPLPPAFQLGSGSWDFFGGVVLTYQTLDFQIDAQAAYKLNTAANGFQFGDEATLDVSLQYRLWPPELGAGTPGFFYGVIEGNLRRRGRNRIAGARDPNSGGVAFYLSPGLQYVTRRWIVEAIVQVPLVQDLNGTALRDDFVVRAGFRVNF